MPTLDSPIDAPSGVTRYGWVPAVAIVAWLSYLGFEAWTHASHSVQTPWGDAISYLQKAVAFWGAVHDGDWFNPFDLEPTIRPPGTVLMSYPFGISEDFHGFYFRSVFLPMLCTVVAVYIAAGRAAGRRTPWWVLWIAVLYSSLPLFYWFDWNDQRWINNGFGMVDNFQAGIAALGAAAMVRTLTDRSLGWQCMSALLFCLTFTIKQSGLMLMGLMGLLSLMMVLGEYRRLRNARQPTRALTRYAVASSIVIVLLFGSCIATAWLSTYLSGDNFAWAVRALGFYKGVTATPSLLVFHLSLGEWLPLLLVATIVFGIISRTTLRAVPLKTGLAVGSVIIWVAGIWYWLVPQGGGIQVRYFAPFILMGLITAVPLTLELWPRAPRPIRSLVAAVGVLPAINIAALLAAGDMPSDRWQYYTGTSVSVGHGREEVDQAYRFLALVRRGGVDEKVFLFPTGSASQFFIDVGVYAKIFAPRLASFSPINPMDWNRGFAVRTHELANSEYVLNRKYSRDKARLLTAPAVFGTFEDEIAAFDAWISQLDASAGLDTVIDGKDLRLLKITDPDRFGSAINSFVAGHGWRPEFRAANPPEEPAWWNLQEVVANGRALSADEVRFGDAYVVHALAVKRIDAAIKVEAWWEPVGTARDTAPCFLFLHLVDETGAIIKNQEIHLKPMQPPDPERVWHYGSVTFDTVPADSKMIALAFGIYHPASADGGLLTADKGRRDWGGKRVLVALP